MTRSIGRASASASSKNLSPRELHFSNNEEHVDDDLHHDYGDGDDIDCDRDKVMDLQ